MSIQLRKFSSGGGGEVFCLTNKRGFFDVFSDSLNSALKYVWDYVLEDVWHSVLATEKAGESFLFVWGYKNKII